MLVFALLATPSAASRPPTWRGEALIVTRSRTDFCVKLPTDAPAPALAASASCKPNQIAEILLREDDLWEGAALFGAWPDATFHQNFSFPVKFSKPTGAASRAAGPTTLKHIGAAADAEFASFDETSGATKIGDPSPEESFTIAAHSEIEELLFLHPCAAVLALLLAACSGLLLRGQQVRKKRVNRSHAAISVPLLSSSRALRVGIVLILLQGAQGTPAAEPPISATENRALRDRVTATEAALAATQAQLLQLSEHVQLLADGLHSSTGAAPERRVMFGQSPVPSDLPTCVKHTDPPPSVIGKFHDSDGWVHLLTNTTTLRQYSAPLYTSFEATSPANPYMVVRAGLSPCDSPTPSHLCPKGSWALGVRQACTWIWNCLFALYCIDIDDTVIEVFTPVELDAHGAVQKLIFTGLETGPDYLVPTGGTAPQHEASTYRAVMERVESSTLQD